MPMTPYALRETILAAFKYFGPLAMPDLVKKVHMRDLVVSDGEIKLALADLVSEGQVSVCATGDGETLYKQRER